MDRRMGGGVPRRHPRQRRRGGHRQQDTGAPHARRIPGRRRLERRVGIAAEHHRARAGARARLLPGRRGNPRAIRARDRHGHRPRQRRGPGTRRHRGTGVPHLVQDPRHGRRRPRGRTGPRQGHPGRRRRLPARRDLRRRRGARRLAQRGRIRMAPPHARTARADRSGIRRVGAGGHRGQHAVRSRRDPGDDRDRRARPGPADHGRPTGHHRHPGTGRARRHAHHGPGRTMARRHAGQGHADRPRPRRLAHTLADPAERPGPGRRPHLRAARHARPRRIPRTDGRDRPHARGTRAPLRPVRPLRVRGAGHGPTADGSTGLAELADIAQDRGTIR